VDGHGVGDGAVAVEEVGLEIALRDIESHPYQFTRPLLTTRFRSLTRAPS
jgi:hypothetical protein